MSTEFSRIVFINDTIACSHKRRLCLKVHRPQDWLLIIMQQAE